MHCRRYFIEGLFQLDFRAKGGDLSSAFRCCSSEWFVIIAFGGVPAELDSECYNSKGTDYRGMASTTVSGGQCLPWNSDLLYDELHVGTVDASPRSGLGDHAFCRYASL